MTSIETMIHPNQHQQYYTSTMHPQSLQSTSMSTRIGSNSNTPLRRATYIKICDLANTYNILPTVLEEELERINNERENQMIQLQEQQQLEQQEAAAAAAAAAVTGIASHPTSLTDSDNLNQKSSSNTPPIVVQRLFTSSARNGNGGIPTELDTSIKKRLQPPRGGNNIVVLVGKVRVVVDKYRVDRSRVRLAVVEVGDETGCVSLRARDDQIDLLQSISEQEGGAVILRNCTQELYQGRHIRLAVTKWGKISAYPDNVSSTPSPPTVMNRERNFSMINLSAVAGDMAPTHPSNSKDPTYGGYPYHDSNDASVSQHGTPSNRNMQPNHPNRRGTDRRPSRGTPTSTSSIVSPGTPQQLHMNTYQTMTVIPNTMSPLHHQQVYSAQQQPSQPLYTASGFALSSSDGGSIPQYYTPQRHHPQETNAQQQQQMMYHQQQHHHQQQQQQQQHQRHSYNLHHHQQHQHHLHQMQQQQQQQQQHQQHQQHMYHHQVHHQPPPPPASQQQLSSPSHFLPHSLSSFHQGTQVSGPYSLQGSGGGDGNSESAQQQQQQQQQQPSMNAQAATYDPKATK